GLLLLVVSRNPAGADLGALRHEPPQQVDVLVVDPFDRLGVQDRRLLLDRSAVLRRRTFLLAPLRQSVSCLSSRTKTRLERLFAVLVVVGVAAGGRGGHRSRTRGGAP